MWEGIVIASMMTKKASRFSREYHPRSYGLCSTVDDQSFQYKSEVQIDIPVEVIDRS